MPFHLLGLTRFSVLAVLAMWGAIGLRVATDSSNHIGSSPLWGLPWLAIVAGSCLLSWRRTRQRAAGVAALFVAASMLALYLVDHFAVLTSYDSWIARGMPPRPF